MSEMDTGALGKGSNERPAEEPEAKIVASFQVAFRRFLGADGAPVAPLPDFAADTALLIRLYRAMVRTRAFDEKAIALQRTGRLGTYASSLGQEAVSIGAAAAMRPQDVFLPSFREQGGQLWRGVTLVELLAYWGGDARGSDFSGPRGDFPVCIPVASHFPHAVGSALALKLSGKHAAALCIGGDGATSKGDFYEAVNIAGAWRLPAVFLINNNQWAISVPRAAQTSAETLAQKAIAAGIPGEQVDGNDIIAVHDAVSRALARARAGMGASLVEALSYRLGDHTTADDASRYRADEEVSRHWKEDPIARLRTYLAGQEKWSKADEEQLLAETAGEIDAAVEAYLATPPAVPASMFDHLFETLPGPLAAQRAALEAEGKSGDG